MTSVMALDRLKSFLRFKDVTNTSKQMPHSQTIGGNSSVQCGKLDETKDFKSVFLVRIEIDQLLCMNC